jgi:hypothetical protein
MLKRSAQDKREEQDTELLRQTEKKLVAVKQFYLNFPPKQKQLQTKAVLPTLRVADADAPR